MKEKSRRLDTSEASNAKLRKVSIKHSWRNLMAKRVKVMFRSASITTSLRRMDLKAVHPDKIRRIRKIPTTLRFPSKASSLTTLALDSNLTAEATSLKKILTSIYCWTLLTTSTLKSIKSLSLTYQSKSIKLTAISAVIQLL